MTLHERPADTVVADALTVDGGIISIRPVTSSDRRAITALYADASAENLRLRFFAHPGPATLAAEIDRLCRPESDRFLALLAHEGERLVGIASCERDGDGPRAEFAVFIADHDHGRGIGTLLLEHLTARAHRLGVTELVGEVLPGNRDMLRVAHDLSPKAWAHFDRGVVDVSLRSSDDEQTRQAIDERDRTAEQASLQPLLSPRAVAVVGAGQSPGLEALRALRGYGFTGRLYPVDRSAVTIDGLPVHPGLAGLPEPIDLLVIAVPADQVSAVLADGAAAGARAAIVLGSGFDAAGAAGPHHLAGVLRLARSHGIRLVGPNSLGAVNTDPRVRLDAGVAPTPPPAGGLGVAAQSAATAAAVLENAVRTGTGVSTLVALGDKADVSADDLIAYWYDDPATRAVALDPESFGNARKFARAVRALSRRKPVLALTSSHPPTEPDAASPHTASLDALFAQAGVIRPDSLGELLDTARMLTGRPLPTGSRLVVLGDGDVLGRLAADAAETAGLRIPALTVGIRRRLSSVVPQTTSADNPLDLGLGATPEAFAAAAAAVAGGGIADMLLITVTGTRGNPPDPILAALGPVLDQHPDLPVAVVSTSNADRVPPSVGERHAPVYDQPERAIRALAHAAAYADWRRQPYGRLADLPGIDAGQARDTIGKAMAEHTGRLPHERAAEILGAYGITIRPTGLDTELRGPGSHHAGAGVELVAGLIHDPLLGRLVLLGPGGPPTGLIEDRVSRLVPMTDRDAARMWRSLSCASMLSGGQGTPPADTRALEDLLLRLARLAEDNPEIAELTLRPLFAGPNGLTVVDAEMRLATAGDEIDPLLRQLSPAHGT